MMNLIRKEEGLPNSLEAEQIVLGGIIKNNDRLLGIMDYVKADDFYYSRNASLYAAMCSMYEEGKIIEISTMADYIGFKRLSEYGGVTYLAELSNQLVTDANYKSYVDILLDKSYRRMIIRACRNAEKWAHSEKISDVAKNLEDAILDIGMPEDVKTLRTSELMDKTLDDINRNYKNDGKIPGISTGFESLDRATNGYQRGDLWTIAARPSIGKTMAVLNLLERLPEEYKAVLFELEMSEVKIGNRLLSSKSMIQSKILMRGQISDEEFIKVTNEADMLSLKDNIFVNCKTSPNLYYIRAQAKKIKMRYGLDVIFIDHIGLIAPLKEHRGVRNLEISEITAGLKALSKDLNVCIVCLSQLNRAVEGRLDKHPILSDMRDSGSIEQDSDLVISLYRDEYYDPDTDKKGIMDFTILKNRDGQVGRLPFHCDLKCQRIWEE